MITDMYLSQTCWSRNHIMWKVAEGERSGDGKRDRDPNEDNPSSVTTDLYYESYYSGVSLSVLSYSCSRPNFSLDHAQKLSNVLLSCIHNFHISWLPRPLYRSFSPSPWSDIAIHDTMSSTPCMSHLKMKLLLSEVLHWFDEREGAGER